jgi:hypothetical protein
MEAAAKVQEQMLAELRSAERGDSSPRKTRERSSTVATLAAASVLLLALSSGSSRAQPIVKGPAQCPSGWSQSGAYCVPPRGAPACVPKHGQCPSGWRQTGGSCCPP